MFEDFEIRYPNRLAHIKGFIFSVCVALAMFGLTFIIFSSTGCNAVVKDDNSNYRIHLRASPRRPQIQDPVTAGLVRISKDQEKRIKALEEKQNELKAELDTHKHPVAADHSEDDEREYVCKELVQWTMGRVKRQIMKGKPVFLSELQNADVDDKVLEDKQEGFEMTININAKRIDELEDRLNELKKNYYKKPNPVKTGECHKHGIDPLSFGAVPRKWESPIPPKEHSIVVPQKKPSVKSKKKYKVIRIYWWMLWTR